MKAKQSKVYSTNEINKNRITRYKSNEEMSSFFHLFIHFMKANNLKELSKSAAELQLAPRSTPRLQLVSSHTLAI